MRIQVTFRGIAHLYKIMNKKWTIDIDISGNTVRDVVNTLISKYGSAIKQSLLDQQGDIDMEMRLVHNERVFLQYGERMDAPLNDGDKLWFMAVG
jgi:molybdopterin converting factor small subunit